MADQKLSELTDEVTSPTGTDRLYVDDAQYVTITTLDARWQALDADLTAIAALTPTDSNIIVGNGSAWVAESGATVRTSLGLAIGTDVQAWDAQLDDIAALTPTDSNVIVGDGANWVAESGATARTSLGVAIGTDVQAYDAGLADIAGLAVTDGNFIVGDGANWVAESGATALTSLGAVALAGDTMTGQLNFSGTTHAGVKLLSLTTTERDALTPAAGMLIYNETDTEAQIYTSSWGSVGGSALPVADTTNIVTGSADATKLFRLEADGITTGTTRVGTIPDADFTFAGINIAQTFSAAQTFSSDLLVTTTNGIDINPGSDVDTDLITVGVTGSPKFYWTESLDSFYMNKGLYFPGSSATFSQVSIVQGLRAFTKTSLGATRSGFFEMFYDSNNVSNASGLFMNATLTDNTQTATGLSAPTGARFSIINASNTTVSESISVAANYSKSDVGTQTSHFLFKAIIPSITSGTLTNVYGFYADNMISATNVYALYTNAGQVRLGDVTTVVVNNSVTNAVTNVLTLSHNSTGTPAAGLGTAVLAQTETTTTTDVTAGRVSWEWATATHGSRKALSKWTVYDTAEREGIRIEASGSAPMIGFLGATAAARQAEITDELTTITHTAPGTPDYAIQNLTMTAPYGFVSQDEGNTVLSVIANLQARVNELETVLVTFGLLTDAD